jgi:hypothetical protein
VSQIEYNLATVDRNDGVYVDYRKWSRLLTEDSLLLGDDDDLSLLVKHVCTGVNSYFWAVVSCVKLSNCCPVVNELRLLHEFFA